MRPPARALFGRLAVVFLALWLTLAGCGPAQSPGSGEAETPAPGKTAKATFTPSGGGSGDTESAATLVPTITPSAESTEAATPTTRAPKPLTMNSPEFGVQTFPWWRPEVASRDMQIAREAGFTWIKVGFGWRDIEGAGKGIFDWERTDRIVGNAEYEGLDLVVRIDHQPEWAGGGFPLNGPPDNLQDLADFLTAITTRYQGRIRAYEIWNEPNLGREWGGKTPNPDEYAGMLKVAYAAVKAGDPNAMVISAGLTPTGSWDDQSRPDDWYLESLYIAMNSDSTGYLDVLGAHAPGYKSPPERDPAEVAANPDLGGHRAFAFRRVEDLRAIMVKYGDSGKQIAILEFGWSSDSRPDSSYYWHHVTEEEKADYIVRAYQYAKANWSPWIGLMSLIYIADPEWTTDNEQYYWAITDPSYPEFKPRPAYEAIKAMAK
ncbi:MAG: cellulase family glycosylhydrolase [Anaerolineae bacterium]